MRSSRCSTPYSATSDDSWYTSSAWVQLYNLIPTILNSLLLPYSSMLLCNPMCLYIPILFPATQSIVWAASHTLSTLSCCSQLFSFIYHRCFWYVTCQIYTRCQIKLSFLSRYIYIILIAIIRIENMKMSMSIMQKCADCSIKCCICLQVLMIWIYCKSENVRNILQWTKNIRYGKTFRKIFSFRIYIISYCFPQFLPESWPTVYPAIVQLQSEWSVGYFLMQ
jgi:hypothetical protein